MAYKIKVWKDGEVIYEEALNHMEKGIAEAHRIAESANSAASNSEHANNKQNPHNVTAAQLGLGNVPNVATNDQTPTYTEASALAKLTSGEKLSAAFAKIARAVTDLIAHLANKENPHSVTKKQLGLDNVPNVTTNDQTPTYTQASALANLSSGEKLSVAFGKISKAVADIILHLSNKSNPHGVTASQVGAAASSHTHAASTITGLLAYLASAGYGKVSTGSYIGDGKGSTTSENKNNYTAWSNARSIDLPFAPRLLLLYNPYHRKMAAINQNAYIPDNMLATHSATTSNVAYLNGASLLVLGSCVYAAEHASANHTGLEYIWIAFE